MAKSVQDWRARRSTQQTTPPGWDAPRPKRKKLPASHTLCTSFLPSHLCFHTNILCLFQYNMAPMASQTLNLLHFINNTSLIIKWEQYKMGVV